MKFEEPNFLACIQKMRNYKLVPFPLFSLEKKSFISGFMSFLELIKCKSEEDLFEEKKSDRKVL